MLNGKDSAVRENADRQTGGIRNSRKMKIVTLRSLHDLIGRLRHPYPFPHLM